MLVAIGGASCLVVLVTHRRQRKPEVSQLPARLVCARCWSLLALDLLKWQEVLSRVAPRRSSTRYWPFRLSKGRAEPPGQQWVSHLGNCCWYRIPLRRWHACSC